MSRLTGSYIRLMGKQIDLVHTRPSLANAISVEIQLTYYLRVTNLQATYLVLQFTDADYAD